MELFAALDNPARREILKKALMEGSISREESFGVADLSKPTIYEHFRILVDSGLLEPSTLKRFRVSPEYQTALKLLLFPQSDVEYLDLNMSTWRILEHQSQFVSVVDEILTGLGRGDSVYNITTVYGLIRMYNHDQETGYFSTMAEKGIDLKILAPVTRANLEECRHMSGLMEMRHLTDENLGLKLSLQGKENVFLWFMEQEENLGIGEEELVFWLKGSVFNDAFTTVFDYLWRRSEPFEERAEELEA